MKRIHGDVNLKISVTNLYLSICLSIFTHTEKGNITHSSTLKPGKLKDRGAVATVHGAV